MTSGGTARVEAGLIVSGKEVTVWGEVRFVSAKGEPTTGGNWGIGSVDEMEVIRGSMAKC